MACLNIFDQITDQTACSYTLLISSLQRPWAYENDRVKKRRPAAFFKKIVQQEFG